MISYPPRVRRYLVVVSIGTARRALTPRSSANQQPATGGLGFPHRAGRFRPGESTFSSPGCRICRYSEGFLIRRWDPILPGWRWLLSRAPANQRSAGEVGVPHREGRFRPGASPFSSPGCRICRGLEGLLNRGWEPILPVCGGIVGFPRGETPAARASHPHWPRAGG